MRRIGVRRGLVLAVSAVLFVVAGAFAWQAHSLQQDPVLDNRAQLAGSTENGIVTVVSRGLTQVLSYDYTQPEATRAFADQVLRGQAREQYDTLFESLAERAPGQQLTLSAVVQLAGVQELTKDKATLLVFLDQRSSRADDEEQSVSAAQLRVTAERDGRTWVITGLQPL
ncbi:Mce-associated membrane protein [Nocardioides lianchengensis]|uniref:Mce-associated membrane protein n=2 Tax=Nocardioides lianchengensis TaxID=1045774 RepID=A0A1G7B8W0_9ACTN|nr:Mce-associated membrane protein [Nocardioides lianchengensis]SDE22685.1 Mce-associated membrane protein [Nocardioides lianchengensis]